MYVTLLGTGTSTGVPILSCDCAVCASPDPRDRRTRTSCLVRVGDLRIVIDTGPDFHRQALREQIDRIDAVCYTHHHFDHVAGIDDLRPFLFENADPIPCYGSEATCRHLSDRHPYIFGERPYPSAPRLELRPIDDRFAVGDRYETGHDNGHASGPGDGEGHEPEPVEVDVVPIPLLHGDLPVLGYRIGPFAYLTDASRIPPASYDRLQGVRVLVLDALRERPHPSHFSFEEAVEVAERIGAEHTYFVHLTHAMRHAALDEHLPEGIHPGHDGLEVRIPEPERATPCTYSS